MHADGLTICSDKYAPPQTGEKLTVCPNYQCVASSHTCTGGAVVPKSIGTLSKIACYLTCEK
jgi:hypothetical protein